jgi:hypothetical protein
LEFERRSQSCGACADDDGCAAFHLYSLDLFLVEGAVRPA